MGLGRAKCWFDEDTKAAKELDGWWERATCVPNAIFCDMRL